MSQRVNTMIPCQKALWYVAEFNTMVPEDFMECCVFKN